MPDETTIFHHGTAIAAATTESFALAVLDEAPDGIAVCDQRGVMIYANRTLSRISGYDVTELVGRSVDDLVPVDSRARHAPLREGFAQAPSVRPMGSNRELVLRHRNGAHVPAEVSLSPITVDGHVCVVASVRDVTQRRRDERERHRLLETLDLVPDAVVIYDADTWRVEYVNHGASHMLGYSRSELMQITGTALVSAADAARMRTLVVRAATSLSGVATADLTLIARSGERVDVEVHTRRIQSEADGPTRFVAVLRDVGQRREIERRMAASELLFRSAFEHAPVGVILTELHADGARILRAVNPAFAAMLNTDAERLTGIDLRTVSHPDEAHQDEAAALEIRAGTSKEALLEKRYRRADGSYVWAELHARALPELSGSNPVTLAHVLDLTERREQQRTRSEARTAAERLRLGEERERIARDLHDTVIQDLFAAGMRLSSGLSRIGDAGVQQRYSDVIDQIDATIRKVRAVVFDLHQQTLGSQSVADVIEATVNEVGRALGFQPSTAISGDLDTLPTRITQHVLPVLREALSNVSRHAHATAAWVRITVQGQMLRLVIEDNGIGISPSSVRGTGTVNLMERARDLAGSVDIGPRDGGGTIVDWCVPIE